jgi:hypothetical protein
MNFEFFWQQYGWVGILGYFVVKDVWPFLRDKWWPNKVKAQDEERERVRKLEERTLKNEEKQTELLESLRNSTNNMTQGITINNERMSQMITFQTEHARFVTDSLVTLLQVRSKRETTARKN